MRWYLFVVAMLAACQSSPTTGLRGTLLAIGGGLDNDSRAVYERFLELAAANGPPRIVVVTAATGDQDQEVVDKGESLRTWQPGVHVEFARRETSTVATVAMIDQATALFFTGGDQKRILDRYRPEGGDSPERRAMLRLLDRGGVIAGASAGDAMLGQQMLLSGRSAPALGIAPPPDDSEESPVLGPQLGQGMGFLPWLLTDSHFFERDRVGRLVAALEAGACRFGLGVGEDAAVEIDLATGDVIGLTPSDSLLVDIGSVSRNGARRDQIRATLLRQNVRINIVRRLLAAPEPPPLPTGPEDVVPVVEAGQNRQLASWRQFVAASIPGSGTWTLPLEGWQVVAWPDGQGGVVFSVGPR